MLSKIRSFGVSGVGGYEVTVEVNIAGGLPHFDMVGLPDNAIKESRDRVRAAIKNNGFRFNASHITINLAPADRKKSGTLYDLPILLGLLSAAGDIRRPAPDCAFIGELSLSGEVRPIVGALPMALEAERCGVKHLFVPAENASEAAFAENIRVYPVVDVMQLLHHLDGSHPIAPAAVPRFEDYRGYTPDFSEVKGQENIKRAFEIAAAGGHNLLIVGPPGSGKSMMAKRLPTILPDMSREEMIETTEIHSVAGHTSHDMPVIFERPFRSPHHTVSAVALSGGGAIPRPGEISLAHNGVLFLDELPEFRGDALEVLRQPLEDGRVTVSRVSGSFTFPSRFMLVCAMNPCRCGWYGHPSGRCKCTERDVRRYQSRISGPLLDRIDLIVEVPALDYDELRRRSPSEPSSAIKARVNAARAVQHQRYAHDPTLSNAHIGQHELRRWCVPDEEGEALMRAAFDSMNLSARSYDRILRVARTIADLDGSEKIQAAHLAEAIQYRTADIMELS